MRSALAILSLTASLAVAGCSSTIGFDDPSADYLQRTALVSTTGGDAQAANIAMQTATPWPRYANDTNIPANGARIVEGDQRAMKAARRAPAEATAQRRARRIQAGARAADQRTAPPPECRFLPPANPEAIRKAKVLSMAERAGRKNESRYGVTKTGPRWSRRQLSCLCCSAFFLGVFEFSWFFYNQQLVVSGLRDAARYMTRIELTDGNRDPCVQKDQNGVLYTADAANIATTAEAAGGSARVNGWSAADVTISCFSSAALDAGNYADGSTSMTIIDVATRFADPSLGLFASLGLKLPMLSFSHEERFIGPG